MSSEEFHKMLDLTLQGITTFLGLFYGLYFLLTRTVNRKATNRLAILFLLLSLSEAFSLITGLKEKSETYMYYWIPVIASVSISLAPTVYLYIRSIIVIKKEGAFWKHYIPAISVFIIDLVLVIIATSTNKNDPDSSTKMIRMVAIYGLAVVTLGSMIGVFIFQSIFYSIRGYRLINEHEREIGDTVSFQEEVSLKWTRVFLFSYIFLFIGLVTTGVINQFVKIPVFEYSFEILVITYFVYVGIRAIKQLNTQVTIDELSHLITEEKEEIKALEEAQPDASSLVIPDEKDTPDHNPEAAEKDKFLILKEKLEVLMEEKKPYLDVSLTIFDLAKQLDTNYKYLSKAINKHFDVNFATYINSYRIKEAQEKLKSPDTAYYKIEAIAEMVGFKSKSAFNGAFKTMVGKTPSQFRDNA